MARLAILRFVCVGFRPSNHHHSSRHSAPWPHPAIRCPGPAPPAPLDAGSCMGFPCPEIRDSARIHSWRFAGLPNFSRYFHPPPAPRFQTSSHRNGMAVPSRRHSCGPSKSESRRVLGHQGRPLHDPGTPSWPNARGLRRLFRPADPPRSGRLPPLSFPLRNENRRGLRASWRAPACRPRSHAQKHAHSCSESENRTSLPR